MTKKIVFMFVLSVTMTFYAQSPNFPFLNNLDFEASDPAAIGKTDPFHPMGPQNNGQRLCGPWQVSHGTPELDYDNTNVNGNTRDFVGHYVRLEAQSAASSGCAQDASEGIFYPNVLSEHSQYRMTICYRAYQLGGGTVDRIGVYWARWINGNPPDPNSLPENPASGARCSEQGWAKSTIMDSINVSTGLDWKLYTTTVLGVPGNSFDDALLITLEDNENSLARFEVAFIRFECLNNSAGGVISIDLLDEEPGGSEAAGQSVTTTGHVPVNSPRKVEFESGQEILLRANIVGQTGFIAEAGCDFLAKIRPPGDQICIYTALITGKPSQETEGNGKNPKGSGLPDKPDTGLENTDHFSVYPNPFTDVVNFKYTVKQANSPIRLQIYTITGGEVTTLIQEERMAVGTYHAQFNGSGLPEGIYLYRLEIGDHVTTGKIVLKK